MGLALGGVASADAGGECVPEIEGFQLAVDAVAVATCDEAEIVMSAESSENATSTSDESWILFAVVFAPDLIGGGPLVLGKFRGAINAIPVGRVVRFEFVEAPGNAHGAEHGEVGGGVSGMGVEKSAVPIEEDTFERGIVFCGHFFVAK